MDARFGRWAAAALVPVVLAGVLVAVAGWAPGRAGASATPLLGKQVIGYSVRHRPIVAYHLGDPRRRPVLGCGQRSDLEEQRIACWAAMCRWLRFSPL